MQTINLSSFVPVTHRRLHKKQPHSQPYCLAFVYSKCGNYLVKGLHEEVTEYINKHLTHSFYRYTFWKNGQSRGGWLSPLQLYIHKRYPNQEYGCRWQRQQPQKPVRPWYDISLTTKDGEWKHLMKVRNLPKR